MQTNNTASATDVGCAVLPCLQVGRGYAFGLILALISTGAQAQSGSSVTVEGVAGSVAVPVMTHPWLLLAAALVVVIGLCKLRQFAALSVLALATTVLVSHQPRLMAAVTDLVIAEDSQVCHGARRTLGYDAGGSMALSNQCEATAVRIVRYQLSCPTENQPDDMNEGFILPAGESTSLRRCIDPAPEITVSGPLSIVEDAGPQTVPDWVSVESLDAAGDPTQTVTLGIAADDMTLFSAGPALGNDGTLSFTPAADAFGSTMLTVTATDSEGVSAEETAQLSITPVNDPPLVTVSPDTVTVAEDSGALVLADWISELSPGPDNEAEQSVSVETGTSDAALFQQLPRLEGNTLHFTPAPDVYGTTTVTVTATDAEGLTATTSATVTITGENDAPSFTLGGPIVIGEDSGPHTYENWVSDVAPGPANEAAQTVSLHVAVDTPALLGAGPVIAANGDLSLAPAPDAFGETTVTVTATDSAGASSTQTVPLTITAVNDPPTFTLRPVLSLLEDNGLDTGTDPGVAEYDEGPDGADSAPVSVDNVATAISPGNAWEADQTVHFEISRVEGSDEYVVYKSTRPYEVRERWGEEGVTVPMDSVQLVQIDNDPFVVTDGVWGIQHEIGFIRWGLSNPSSLINNGDWILVATYDGGRLTRAAIIDGDPGDAEPGDLLNTLFASPAELPIISGSDNYQLSPAGTFSTALTPHAWGVVEFSVVAVDSEGLRSAPQRLRLDVAPVWDTRPTGRNVEESGDENDNCIQVSLPGFTFRNSHRPQFILTEVDLNGGRLTTNGFDAVFGAPTTRSSFCYEPPRDSHSEYDAESEQFEPFASLTYRVWSGVGDWHTGESPALDGSDSSGVFLELSPEEYTVEIVVTPTF